MIETTSRIEDVLARKQIFVGTCVGVSMYPMLRQRRDTVVIRPAKERLKRYDVALYRRGEKYVIHRVLEARPEGYLIRGDNCIGTERVSEDRIVGVLSGFYRDERKVNMDGLPYRLYSRTVVALHPLLTVYKRCRHRLGRIIRKLKIR